jgi:UDP-N-acetylglucosamine 2-epimerase (non-hydrolysing)
MPEEINRILTDHLADLLFVTEESGLHNLATEGIAASTVHLVGNTMIDSLLACREKAELSGIREMLGLDGRYGLLTLHRPANVDNREALLNILEGIEDLAREYVVIFPAHPRTQKRLRDFGIEDRFDWAVPGRESGGAGIRITEPLGYLDFLSLMSHAAIVVTDSGGIQEETTFLGVPCVTVRENTERPATVEVGTNVMAGVHAQGIRSAIRRQLAFGGKGSVPVKWDGRTAGRIVEVLLRRASAGSTREVDSSAAQPATVA